MALRGKAEILMGKNTLIRKALRGLSADNPDIVKLMTVVRGNVGFVFTKGDLVEIRDTLHSFKVCSYDVTSVLYQRQQSELLCNTEAGLTAEPHCAWHALHFALRLLDHRSCFFKGWFQLGVVACC
jgi:hypothetical protein